MLGIRMVRMVRMRVGCILLLFDGMLDVSTSISISMRVGIDIKIRSRASIQCMTTTRTI